MSSPRFKDLTGKVYNWLIAVEKVSVNKNGDSIWRFRCKCGNEIVRVATLIKRGHIKACGCMRGDRHSESLPPTAEYIAWGAMLRRCFTTSAGNYGLYGGRGIGVCREWKTSYNKFLEDMGRKPSENHSLDRIDVESGYSKANCRWATTKEQANNRRNTRVVEVFGKRQSASELAEKIGTHRNNIYYYLNKGFSGEAIVKKFQERLK